MSTKLQRIQNLSEAEFRETVLVPLLARMGFHAPSLYHGQREYGKDVTAFDIDRLGKRWYLGVVAKTGDLTGAVSGSRSLREVVFQAEQCFTIPYRDLYGMTEATMDQVWICTSGKIVPGAADSVYQTLAKQNLTKLVRVISGEDMVRLLDEFYPAFWGETETLDALRDQRDRAFDLIRRTFRTLGAKADEVSGILQTLGSSPHLPTVTLEGSIRMARASTYRIELEASDDSISPIFSSQCGWIREQYLKARQQLSSALMDVEEVIFNYDKVAATNRPDDFLREFDRLLAGEHPFHRPYGDAADAVAAIGYLEEGLIDVQMFERALKSKGRLEWAHRAFRAILESKDLIAPVLASAEGSEFVIYWTEHDEEPLLRPEFAEPVGLRVPLTSRTDTLRDYRPRYSRETIQRRVAADEVIASAGSALRCKLEEDIGFEWEDWQE